MKYTAMIGVTLLGAVGALAATTPGGPEFDRYRVILDRKPFGEISPAEVSSATSPPSESLTKELEMRAIIDEGNGIRAGFLDKKSNKTFYLGIGETNDGYQLVSVNYDNEEAVLRRGTDTSLFTLKSTKTAPPAGTAPTPSLGPSLGAPNPPPAPGLTPTPLSSPTKPFFSDVKKKKFSPFKPLGTNAPIPFQTQSIESFMKANSNTARPFSAPFRPLEPGFKMDGKGDTIEGLLRANPDATRQFSPLKPPDPNVKVDGKGDAIESFLIKNPDQTQPAQLPAPVPFPGMEEPAETPAE